MPDIFDQVEQSAKPAGDVFDQVAPGAPKGDVFDEVAPERPRLHGGGTEELGLPAPAGAGIAVEELPPWRHQPLIDVASSKGWLGRAYRGEIGDDEASKLLHVGIGAAGESAAGLVTPENLGIMGGLAAAHGAAVAFPPVAPVVGALDIGLAGYFGIQMLRDVVARTPEAWNAYKEGRHADAIRIAVPALVETVFAKQAGSKLVKAGVRTLSEPRRAAELGRAAERGAAKMQSANPAERAAGSAQVEANVREMRPIEQGKGIPVAALPTERQDPPIADNPLIAPAAEPKPAKAARPTQAPKLSLEEMIVRAEEHLSTRKSVNKIQLGKALGVKPSETTPVIQELARRGRITRDKSGRYWRTVQKQAEAAARPAATEAAPPPPPGFEVVPERGHKMTEIRPTVDHGILSPSGRVSKRAEAAAKERTRRELFGEKGLERPTVPQPTEAESLRRRAAELRSLAERGMKPKAYARKAAELEARAGELEGAPGPAKEPWQMTREEFREAVRTGKRDFPGRGTDRKTGADLARALANAERNNQGASAARAVFDEEVNLRHEAAVTIAAATGKPVPPEVLRDYPNLSPPAPAKTPITPQESTPISEPPKAGGGKFEILEGGKGKTPPPTETEAQLRDIGGRVSAAMRRERMRVTPKSEAGEVTGLRPDKKGERGSFSLRPKSPVEEGPTFTHRAGAYQGARDAMKRVSTRIAEQGESGKELARRIDRAADLGEIEAGKRVVRLQDAGLHKLSVEDRANLLDVLEGRAEPKSDSVRRVFNEVRGITDEIAGEAEAAKVQVREKRTIKPGEKFPEGFKPTRGQQERHEAGQRIAISYRRPFRRRENFFPHVIPDVESLRSGAIRRDVIQNIVRQGIRPNETSAAEFLDAYRAFIDKGGRQKALEQYLIESGQAKDGAEALRLLTQFRKRAIKRQGSLEYSRQVDLPFYDPDPARVLPQFVTAQSMRLAQIREFGQDNQRINRLIKKIDDAGGNDALVRSWVDRITGIVQEPDTGAARLSRLLRVAQGFKLGLAFIPNATQGALNTLLRSRDLGTVLAGGKGLLSAEGRRFARQSGASLEGVITEMLRHAGAEHSALGTFLKATGFSATEQANRVWAANSGLHWANLNLRRLKLNPRNAKARHALEELGLDPDALLKAGKLDGDAALMAAKKFSDLTQFRSRPQDMPAFASTTWGKVFWQFKNYPYNQMRLVYDGLVGELRRGNPGEAAKTFLLLATVFPLTGEAIADVRSFITGRKRTTKGLERYFENIAQAGSLGMVYELLESAKYGKALEHLVGPTVSEAGQIIDTARRENRARNLTKMAFRRIPGIGPVLVNRLFPPRRSGGRKSAARDVGGRY